MADRQQSFFVPGGGNLALDAPSYISRNADTELYTALLTGSYCYVLTSRQMGKSSLMVRTAARLREDGVVPVIVDLTGLGAGSATVNQWYASMLVMIGEQLGLDDEIDDFLSQNREMSPLQLWRAAIRQTVCSWRQDRIVIFVDEIDVTRSLPFTADEFFVAIREMYNARTVEPALNRLTFCLLGAARPADLIDDRLMTPFNIGIPIVLTDFTFAEAAPLACGLLPSEKERQASPRAYQLLSRILYWTGGQPYLTQALCASVAKALSAVTLPQNSPLTPVHSRSSDTTDSAIVDGVCAEMFFASDSMKSQQHLGFVQSYLLRICDSNQTGDDSANDPAAGLPASDARASGHANLHPDTQLDTGGLLLLYARILRGGNVPADAQSVIVSILQLAGVVREENGLLRPRNRIYAHVFNRQWVRDHLPQPELRRQRSAFIRGAIRGAAVVGMAATILFTSLFAINQTRSNARLMRSNSELQHSNTLRQQSIAMLQRVEYDADIKLAQEDWDDGNVGRADALLSIHKGEAQNFATGYVHRLAHSDIHTFDSKSLVFHVSYSPDGRLLAAACADSTVQIWDTASYQLVHTLSGHKRGVLWASFSADGHLLVTASADNTVRLWDVDTGKQIAEFKTDAKEEDGANCVAFCPINSNIVAAGDGDGTLWVWDRRSKHRARFRSTVPSNYSPHYHGLAFSPDGRKLILTGWDTTHGLIDLWDAQRWTRIAEYDKLPSSLDSPAFSPDGAVLAVSQVDGRVDLLDAKTLHELGSLPGLLHDADGVAFSHSGKWLAATSWDNTVRLWDWKSRNLLAKIIGHTGRVTSVGFSPGDRILASGGADGVKLWDIAEQCRPGTIRFPDGVNGIALSPTEPLLAVASGSRISLYDTQTQSAVGNPWNAGPGTLMDIAFSPDGRSLISSTDKRQEVRIWDIHIHHLIRSLKCSIPNATMSRSALSPDGRLVAASTSAIDPASAGTLCFWDAATGRVLQTLKLSDREGADIAFRPDGRRIVSGLMPNDVSVWDTNTGKCLAILAPPHTGNLQSVAWSPDGNTIATTSWDSTVRLWDAGTFKPVAVLRGHNGSVLTCCFSEDSQYLITGGEDRLIKCWDIKMAHERPPMAREVLTLKDYAGRVTRVVLSRDSRLLVSYSANTVRFWRADTN